MHKLHVFVLVEYDFPLSMIAHFIECCMFLSFSDHMYWLSLVAFLLSSCLKVLVCPLYLVLNVLSVSPMYVSSLLLSCLVTVAWYIMPEVRHCPFSGHGLFCRQLQLLCVVSVLLVFSLSNVCLL